MHQIVVGRAHLAIGFPFRDAVTDTDGFKALVRLKGEFFGVGNVGLDRNEILKFTGVTENRIDGQGNPVVTSGFFIVENFVIDRAAMTDGIPNLLHSVGGRGGALEEMPRFFTSNFLQAVFRQLRKPLIHILDKPVFIRNDNGVIGLVGNQ